MKKLSFVMRAIVFCVVIIIFLVGCFKFFGIGNRIKLGEPAISEPNTIPGMSMEVVGEPDSRAVTVRVSNDTDTDYISDRIFAVNAEKDGVWYELEQVQEIANTGELNSYKSNSETELTCGFQRYGRMPKGHYRVVYRVFESESWPSEEFYYIAAEFYIE